MRKIYCIIVASFSILLISCSSFRSGAEGNTAAEIPTHSESINRYDLDIDPEYITYTIDISTVEGKIALNGLTLEEAKDKALNDAAIKYKCTTIFGAKFSYLKKGKHILRITVSGQPAKYKNSQKTASPDKENNNVIIIK